MIPAIVELDDDDAELLRPARMSLPNWVSCLRASAKVRSPFVKSPALLGETDIEGLVKDLAAELRADGTREHAERPSR